MPDRHTTAVLDIYRQGIATGHATFSASTTDSASWPAARAFPNPRPGVRFTATRLLEQRFVAADDHGEVLGWIACSRVSDRCVYPGVVEHSVYVHRVHAAVASAASTAGGATWWPSNATAHHRLSPGGSL
jgi:phosphinothricin acetyltransferase